MIIYEMCDLSAKACFLNMKAHNGIYGCCKCKIKSIKEGNTRVYPYQEELNLRTSHETASRASKSIEGVEAYNFIDTTSIDSI